MLADELSHVLRRDPAWLLIAGLVESVLFFQPLQPLGAAAAAGNRRVHLRRLERAADRAARWRCLPDRGRGLGGAGAAAAAGAGHGPRGSDLARRVHRLLDGGPRRSSTAPRWLAALWPAVLRPWWRARRRSAARRAATRTTTSGPARRRGRCPRCRRPCRPHRSRPLRLGRRCPRPGLRRPCRPRRGPVTAAVTRSGRFDVKVDRCGQSRGRPPRRRRRRLARRSRRRRKRPARRSRRRRRPARWLRRRARRRRRPAGRSRRRRRRPASTSGS